MFWRVDWWWLAHWHTTLWNGGVCPQIDCHKENAPHAQPQILTDNIAKVSMCMVAIMHRHTTIQVVLQFSGADVCGWCEGVCQTEVTETPKLEKQKSTPMKLNEDRSRTVRTLGAVKTNYQITSAMPAQCWHIIVEEVKWCTKSQLLWIAT